MHFLRRFMMGRYGSDQLNMGLLVLSCLLTLSARLSGVFWIVFLAYAPLLFAVFRMLSKNTEKRRAENQWFLRYWTPVRLWIKRRFDMLRQRKEYRFYRCPGCRATVRVPKGTGKIEIHCPKCGGRFVKKT